jgi:hypothetical protein
MFTALNPEAVARIDPGQASVRVCSASTFPEDNGDNELSWVFDQCVRSRRFELRS